MDKLRINEMFKSIQGEGNEAGRVTCFIRFVGCDFKCSFCDSKHTWQQSDSDLLYTPQELMNEVEKLNVNHITLTGGNPAIYNTIMGDFIQLLKKNKYKVSIETQGSIYREWFSLLDSITISPKFIDNHLTPEKYIETVNAIIYTANDYGVRPIIKSPIFALEDIEMFKAFTSQLEGSYSRYLSVGNSWVTLDQDYQLFMNLILDRYRHILDVVLADKQLKDVSVLPQIHTLLWHNKQGV